MIIINTDDLGQVMELLAAANREIDDALSILTQVTVHSDWGCPERHQINDMVRTNRNLISQLQSDTESFCAATQKVIADFVETEKGISNLFPSVEALLEKVLSIIPIGVSSANPASRTSSVSEWLTESNWSVPKHIFDVIGGETTLSDLVRMLQPTCYYIPKLDLDAVIGVCDLSELGL